MSDYLRIFAENRYLFGELKIFNVMAKKNYLKEDGSLDIERINKLPIEEYMDVIGNLTQEQYKYYLSKTPINESQEPVRAVVVDDTLAEEIERGDAEDFLNEIREKYLNRR